MVHCSPHRCARSSLQEATPSNTNQSLEGEGGKNTRKVKSLKNREAPDPPTLRHLDFEESLLAPKSFVFRKGTWGKLWTRLRLFPAYKVWALSFLEDQKWPRPCSFIASFRNPLPCKWVARYSQATSGEVLLRTYSKMQVSMLRSSSELRFAISFLLSLRRAPSKKPATPDR